MFINTRPATEFCDQKLRRKPPTSLSRALKQNLRTSQTNLDTMADYSYSYQVFDDANESSWDTCTNNACSEVQNTYQPTTNTEVDAKEAFEYEYPNPEYCSLAYYTDRLDENTRAVPTTTPALRTSALQFRNSAPAHWAQASRNYQNTNPSLNTAALAANALAFNALIATASMTAGGSTATEMRVCSDGKVREYFSTAGQSRFIGVSRVPLTARPHSRHQHCCINGYRWFCYVQGCTGSFKCGCDMTRHFKEKHRSELTTYNTARLTQRRW